MLTVYTKFRFERFGSIILMVMNEDLFYWGIFVFCFFGDILSMDDEGPNDK